MEQFVLNNHILLNKELLNPKIIVGVLPFSRLFSLGNSAQIGVEEVLEHFDETFNSETSSKIKLLYIESIENPQKLLKHATSLIQKGCKIAAIKAGSSSAGRRAASSHTGALANSDDAVDALFKKAYINRDVNPQSRRQSLISLTEKGKAICKEINNTNDSFFLEIFNSFSE